MAISIGGTVVIDDGRNVLNINDIRVGVVTITGSTGDITTPGTVSAAAITGIPDSPIYFNPPDNATNVQLVEDIIVTFSQNVAVTTTGIGSTANITLRSGDPGGTVIETIGIASTSVTVSGAVVTINPLNNFPVSTNIYVVIDANAFTGTSSGQLSPLINDYNFTSRVLALGDSYEGGVLLCSAGSIHWVVATEAAEVSRNWYARNDATTTAQAVSGCVGWFIPTCAQTLNPGYTRNFFWDNFSPNDYWSSTGINADNAYHVSILDGSTGAAPNNKPTVYCVRAFRCVTY